MEYTTGTSVEGFVGEIGIPMPAHILSATVNLAAVYIGSNSLTIEDVPRLIREIHSALSTVGIDPTTAAEVRPEPAVKISQSIKPDYIVCLEDGKKLKMLKRHLMTAYGMTPDDYRKRWGLPSDYPMTCSNYSARRAQLAVEAGLGRKPAPVATPTPAPVAKKAGRSRKAAA